MKTFKQHTSEEWVLNTKKLGDVFKNPTPKEFKELADKYSYIGGILNKKDVYLFGDGLHTAALWHLKLKPKQSHLFRAELSSSGVTRLHGTGGNINVRDHDELNSWLRLMADVYGHKSLTKFMKNSIQTTFKDAKTTYTIAHANLSHFDNHDRGVKDSEKQLDADASNAYKLQLKSY